MSYRKGKGETNNQAATRNINNVTKSIKPHGGPSLLIGKRRRPEALKDLNESGYPLACELPLGQNF